MNLIEAIDYMCKSKNGMIKKKGENDDCYYYQSKITKRFLSTKDGYVNFEINTLDDLRGDKWEKYIPVLDDEEKEYIESVIAPFKGRVTDITKYYATSKSTDISYIAICVKSSHVVSYETIALPTFCTDNMYRHMEVGRAYTLEELKIL